jgi:S-adenosylmethionine:tRNA ribosyltransferase-isomerase
VAAPTAGLHFDDALFARLDAAGIRRAFLTLHVGAGTFQPVRTENLPSTRCIRVVCHLARTGGCRARNRARGGRVIAVGTTSLRAGIGRRRRWHAGGGQRRYRHLHHARLRFRIVDALITNFHLPKSTLLMLVSALAGVEAIRAPTATPWTRATVSSATATPCC